MKKPIIALSLLLGSTFANAEYLVVAPASNTSNLSKDQICNLFLSKQNEINGTEYKVYLPSDKSLIESFYSEVCGKNIAAVRRKWAQLVFSGRQKIPPPGKADSVSTFLLNAASDNELIFVKNVSGGDNVSVVFRQ